MRHRRGALDLRPRDEFHLWNPAREYVFSKRRPDFRLRYVTPHRNLGAKKKEIILRNLLKHTQHSLIISDEKTRQAILEALADKESLKILDAAVFHSKPINDIIRETGIAHTTAYRKVNSLLQVGLLVVQKTKITPDGKKYSEVRSTMRSFNVKYDLGELVVESVQNYSPVEAVAENFFSMDS